MPRRGHHHARRRQDDHRVRPVAVASGAGKLRIPIHTVALGSLDTTIPNPFGPPIPVPPDPGTLRRIAQASGGRAFTAEEADQLNSIYKTLGSQLGIKKQPKEISASFAIGGLILLLSAGVASQRWAGACPDRRTQPPPACAGHGRRHTARR